MKSIYRPIYAQISKVSLSNTSSSMASESSMLHFVLIPLMSPGHLIPMFDMAKLLAQHSPNIMVTIVTTPLNAIRFKSTVQRASDAGYHIQLLELQFPFSEAGLPEGCENMDKLPSRYLIKNFYHAASLLQNPFEEMLEKMQPRASCIISGKNLPWTIGTASKFKIPRLFFDGMGCFNFCVSNSIEVTKVHQAVKSNSDPFIVPGLPHVIELTRAKLPENLNLGATDLSDVRDTMKAREGKGDGIVVNTFEEMEEGYVEEVKRVKGNNVWFIGPVSASNKMNIDKAERGNGRALWIETTLINWLDSCEPNSVVYACLGSICGLTAPQLIELGLGLEASNNPFIWVIRGDERVIDLEKWVSEEKFEERTKGRGFIIRGWAPQVLILSHRAIGAFLTHCGWNSTLEGVTSGVPILTCPLFAEQFFNEKLVVEVLGVGVSVGVEEAVTWGQEDKFGLVMKREEVKKAIEKVMEKSEEGEERREKARKLGEKAKGAIEIGGSSYMNLEKLIKFVEERNIVNKKIGEMIT